MAYIDFVSGVHKLAKRDYLARVNEFPKAKASAVAVRFDRDYWDGERFYGYGGYRYDGRWKKVAAAIAAHYGLKRGDKVLDVGCG
jgi:protein-L-isoaspartate(D-aspartate) O-methyltransferase